MTNKELFLMSELQRQNLVFLIYNVCFIILAFINIAIGAITGNDTYNYLAIGWAVFSLIPSYISSSKRTKLDEFKDELESRDIN